MPLSDLVPETAKKPSRGKVLLASLAGGIGLLALSRVESNQAPPPPVPWAAMAKGKVDLEGGLIRLAASRDGLITGVFVEEGSEVTKGQVLATQDDRPPKLALALAGREVEQARAQLPLIRLKLEAARREERRLGDLVQVEGATPQELDQAKDLHRQLEAELGAAEAAVSAARARADQAAYEVEQRQLRAPMDGRVVKRWARPGDGVSTLNVTPLFLFAPHGPRIVRADLEETFLGAVRPGQEAEILLESDETRVCKGRVLRLGKIVGTKPPSEDPSERADTRAVECVLSLDGQDLLVGQRVLVRFRNGGRP